MKSQNSITDFLSRKISHFMAVMTLFVVFIHYSSSYVSNVDGINSLRILDYFGQGITRNAVPLFFFMSGILTFFKVLNIDDVVRGTQKRIYSLGVPFLIWNVIAMLFYLSLDVLNGNAPLHQFTMRTLLEGLFLNKYLGPFWYIRYLLIFSFLSPLLYHIIKKKYLAISFLCILVLLHLFNVWSMGALYYFLGGFLSMHYKGLIQNRFKANVSIVLIILWVLLQIYRVASFDVSTDYVSARETMPYLIYELFSPILMWFAFDFINYESVRVRKIEKHTFIVYAAHYMMVSLLTADAIESFFFIPNNSHIYTIVIFFIMPVVIYLTLAGISIFLQNKFNNLYKLLTGGR